MPEVEEDLVEGFRITETRDGLDVTRAFHCKDLEGDTPVEIFSSALTLTNGLTNHTGGDIPEKGEALTLADGRIVYCIGRALDPWPPNDAGVVCTYSLTPPAESSLEEGEGEFFSTTQISGGTTLEQGESNFDADNLKLPFTDRQPMLQTYSGTIGSGVKAVTAPILLPKSVINYTRTETTDPSGRSREYTGKRNAGEWLGLAAKTALMLSVTFDSSDGGLTYDTTYSVAYDPNDKFNATSVYSDETGVTPPDVSVANGGVKKFEMQDTIYFDDLNIVL